MATNAPSAVTVEREAEGPEHRAPPRSPWRGETRRRSDAPPTPQAKTALSAIKALHTFAWVSIESCKLYVLYTEFRGRSDRHAALAGAVVTGECLIFAANGYRCPLTKWAESLGAHRGGVTDIYLPKWVAHNLPAIHVPMILLAVALHGRNLRHRRTEAN
jgi:hypothetical protein